MSLSLTFSAAYDSARHICNRLQQATRSLRLYPVGHPTAHSALADFTRELREHVDRYGPLTLRVEEGQLLFDDQEVYYQEDLRTSLAFTMFRDGIRFLTFRPGIEESEVEAFVDCLAHADDLAGVGHDLATVLWERDLRHIDYEVVDPLLGSEGQTYRRKAINDLQATVLRRLAELTPGTGGSGSDGVAGLMGGDGGGDDETGGTKSALVTGEPGEETPSPGVADPASVVLTEADIRNGEAALAGLENIVEDFTVVLLEIAGLVGPSQGKDLLARALGLVVERYLEDRNVEGLTLIVDRLRALEESGRQPPEFAAQVFTEAATSQRIACLIETMGEVHAEDAERIEDVFRRMRDWITPALLEILAESDDRAIRKTALDLLELQGGVPIEHLWPLLRDPRWYVVRNAVALATGSGDPRLIDHLEPLLHHEDARVRREVMRSLDTLPGTRSAVLFVRALSDGDSAVRVLAAKGLGRHGTRANVTSLEALIGARDFATRPAEEVSAMLIAYATLGGETTIAALNKMWRRRMFGTRPMPMRIGAVQALGVIHSSTALESLKEAAKSNEAQIQRTAARALAEVRSRMTGDRMTGDLS